MGGVELVPGGGGGVAGPASHPLAQVGVRVPVLPDAVSHVLPLGLPSLRAEAPDVSPLLGVDVMVVSVTQGELPIGQGRLH